MKKVVCNNSACSNYGKKLTKDNIISTEIVDTFYNDLSNGEQYSEAEQVPSDHSYSIYDIEATHYECPECGVETRDEKNIFKKTVNRD